MDDKLTLLPPHMPGEAPPPGAVLADVGKLSHINTYGDLPRWYKDYVFTCIDCGARETWTAEQQKWYYEEAKGHISAVAVRCGSCRKLRKTGGQPGAA